MSRQNSSVSTCRYQSIGASKQRVAQHTTRCSQSNGTGSKPAYWELESEIGSGEDCSPAGTRVTLARLPAAMKLVAPHRSLWQESILQFPLRCVPFAGG